MEKNKNRIFCSILVTLFLTLFFVGVNLIKIYSNYEKNISTQNAKLSFNINRGSRQDMKNLSFISCSDKANISKKLAPGFEGKIELELDSSKSEVDIEYCIKISEKGNKPQNMHFQAEVEGKTSKIYTSLKELANNELTGKILKSDINKVRNITIYAIWPYETGTDSDSIFAKDIEDTNDGQRANSEKEHIYDYEFSLKVVSNKARTTNKKLYPI